MNRSQLEHIIRAAGSIAEDDEIIIIGSQAILGQFPNAPSVFLVSLEADVFPMNHPDRADLIDGSIGEGSPFESTFGYYAHGVSPNTAILPDGWKARLVSIGNENTRGIIGWCLEVHDLALAKYAAGRDKDSEFNKNLFTNGYVSLKTLLERLPLMSVDDTLRDIIKQRILRDSTYSSNAPTLKNYPDNRH